MRNLRRAVWVAIIGFMVLGLNSLHAEKIKDLPSYLKSNTVYKKGSSLDKLKVLAKLIRDKKINASDKNLKLVSATLIKGYMSQKGKDDPKARLEAFAELKTMAGWKKPLSRLYLDDSLCSKDFARYLMNLKNYRKASPGEKLKILKTLKGKNIWAGDLGTYELNYALITYLNEKTSKLKPNQVGLQALKMLSKMKNDGVVAWSGIYGTLERRYLILYLDTNTRYQKMSPKQQIEEIAKLAKEGQITNFLRSDFEAPIVVGMLLKDKSFMNADEETQKNTIKKMQKDKIIHFFTKGKVQRMMGLPR